ncbi:MAG: hypothetical protein ACRDLP_00645 [Solirubrobacteraceae bacterium]
MNADFFDVYAEFARRWGWRFIPLAIVFWALFWPLGAVWVAVTLICRYRSLDHGPAARTQRRVARLLAWYPPDWRARYGVEFSELLRDKIRAGDGGLRLTLNVMRESNAARIVSAGGITATTCWSLWWLPLFAQGIAPMSMKLAGTSIRSWCLARYVPNSYQWPIIAAMITIGLVMVGTAIHATSTAHRAG